MGFVSAADDEEGWVQTTEANDVRIYRGTVRIDRDDNRHLQHDDIVDALSRLTLDPAFGYVQATPASAALTVANRSVLARIDPPPVPGQIAFLTESQEILMRLPWDGWFHFLGPTSPEPRIAPLSQSTLCPECAYYVPEGELHQCSRPEIKQNPKTAWERLDDDDF